MLKHDARRPVLVQGKSSKGNLIRAFRGNPNSILLGTSSFWEGVDVRGARLRMVAINKLPFATPNDPLSQGRAAWYERQGNNYFFDVALPQAVIQLRQGVGRLIRDEEDHGAILLGDIRLREKSYGKVFLNSLPPMKKCLRVEQLYPYVG